MALPATKDEILDAVVTALEAAVWPVAIDAAQPVVFRSVEHSADFPMSPFDLTRHLGTGTAVAMVTDKGSQSLSDENDEFSRLSIGVGVLHYYPNDTTGKQAMRWSKGLRALALRVRRTLKYQQGLGDSLWLARESGSAVIVDGSGKATGWLAQELTFRCDHMDLLPTELSFTTQPPDTSAATVFTPSPVVASTDTAFTGNVTVSLVDAGGVGATLSGTLTQAAVAGVATFDDLEVDLNGTFQLRATATGHQHALSDSFTISGLP